MPLPFDISDEAFYSAALFMLKLITVPVGVGLLLALLGVWVTGAGNARKPPARTPAPTPDQRVDREQATDADE
jgi:hypothetical protein